VQSGWPHENTIIGGVVAGARDGDSVTVGLLGG